MGGWSDLDLQVEGGWFGGVWVRGVGEGGDDVTIFRSNKSPEQGPNLSRS